MGVLITCKNKEDPIQNEAVRVVTTLFVDFRYSRAANSEVSDGILPKFKLIQALMDGLVTCKTEESPSKNEDTKVVATFSSLEVYWDFPQGS